MIEFITAYNPMCGYKAVHYKWIEGTCIWEVIETSKCIFNNLVDAETYALGWATKYDISYVPMANIDISYLVAHPNAGVPMDNASLMPTHLNQ